MAREDDQPVPEARNRTTGVRVADALHEQTEDSHGAAQFRPARRNAWAFWKDLTRSSAAGRLDADDLYWDTHGLLWLGFSFAAGIAVYGYLPEEPYWPLLLACCGLLVLAISWRGMRMSPGKPLLMLLALVCGLTAAAVRTAASDAPRLFEPLNADLTGTVVSLQENAGGQRLLLEVETVNGAWVGKGGFPERVRIQVRGESASHVGDRVAARTRLFPPPGPVSPGGYDFAFRAYFDRIGGTGFSYGPVETLESGATPLRFRAAAFIENVRNVLAERIRQSLADRPEAALAVALLVGERSGITEDQENDLRAAGLAHILAISGLHMALFAGGAYSATLFLLALLPGVSLRWPIHKWAALAALGAATAYLVISGGAVATQRSFLMIALVFLGILIGRRGLTLRSVALAGLFLLLIAPERLFFPGFQMSFAAVICLVAVYDLWRQRERFAVPGRKPAGPVGRTGRFVGKWILGLAVTALVAGVATGIIGAHHFARIAPYGLLGNLLGMPVFTLIVMPMGVLAMMLMPFGLAALPLSVMAFGLSLLLDVAGFTAGLGDGAGAVGRLGACSAVLLVAALFAGLLLPGKWRVAAGGPLIAGICLTAVSRPPDILVAASGTRIAARDIDGLLRYSGSRSSFASDLWLQDEGVTGDAIKSRKMKSPQQRCEKLGCVVVAHGSKGQAAGVPPVAIALPRAAEALVMDCRYADIIVSDLSVPGECRAGLVLDRDLRARHGALAIWLEQEAETDRQDPPAVLSAFSQEDESWQPAMEAAAPSEDLAGAVIREIRYAIPDPPRPWHRQGKVTRSTLPPRKRTED